MDRPGATQRCTVYLTACAYACTLRPFRVLPVVKELGRTRLEVNVKVKAMFTFKLFATNVVIKIPLPSNTAVANVSGVLADVVTKAARFC